MRQFAAELKRSWPEVEKVCLFGSYATDMYGPASDVDLLIILRQSRKRFLDRIPDFVPDDVSVGCDVFPYTAEEIGNMKRDGNPWIRQVLNEIIWL